MSDLPSGSEGRGAESQGTGAERRLAVRKSVEKQVKLLPPDGSDAPVVTANLADISASGIGLRVGIPIGAGILFRVAALAGKGMLYRVVRCKPLDDGEFEVGAVFVRTLNSNLPPTDDDLAAAVQWHHTVPPAGRLLGPLCRRRVSSIVPAAVCRLFAAMPEAWAC